MGCLDTFTAIAYGVLAFVTAGALAVIGLAIMGWWELRDLP